MLPSWLNCTHTSLCHAGTDLFLKTFSFPLVQQLRNASYSSLLQHKSTHQWRGKETKLEVIVICYIYRPTQVPPTSRSASAELRVAGYNNKKKFSLSCEILPVGLIQWILTARACHTSQKHSNEIRLLKHTHTYTEERPFPSHSHTLILDPWKYTLIGTPKMSLGGINSLYAIQCYDLKDLKLPHLSPWNDPTEVKGKQSQALRSKYYQSHT